MRRPEATWRGIVWLRRRRSRSSFTRSRRFRKTSAIVSFALGAGLQPGRLLQVIYVLKAQSAVAYASIDTLDWDALKDDPGAKVARIIHAMDLTDDMKRQFRRIHR